VLEFGETIPKRGNQCSGGGFRGGISRGEEWIHKGREKGVVNVRSKKEEKTGSFLPSEKGKKVNARRARGSGGKGEKE